MPATKATAAAASARIPRRASRARRAAARTAAKPSPPRPARAHRRRRGHTSTTADRRALWDTVDVVTSVLSDGTIRRLVEEGRIVIEPWAPELVQPASV